jgi:adenylate cyclase class IV
LGRPITFDDIYDAIKEDFKETDKAFRRRRRHLAEKY